MPEGILNNDSNGEHREVEENVENETQEAEQQLRKRKIAPTAKINGENSVILSEEQKDLPGSSTTPITLSSIDPEESVQNEENEREKTVPPSPRQREKTFEDYLRDDEQKSKKEKQTPDNCEGETTQEAAPRIFPLWLANLANESLKAFVIVSLFLCFALLVVLVPQHFKNTNASTSIQNDTMKPWTESQKFFEKRIRFFMNKKFLSQKPETWVQILSAVNSTLSEREPKQPAAIVLLTPPSLHRSFISCFSRKLTLAINDAHLKRNGTATGQQRSIVKEINTEYFDNKETVTDIHDDLKQYLKEHKVVVVYDVDQIRREDHLLIFHGFCDSSQAYDKRATYLFVLSVPEDIYETSDWQHKNGEEIAQRVLNKAWEDILTPDKRPALISRILANIVVINEGDECEL